MSAHFYDVALTHVGEDVKVAQYAEITLLEVGSSSPIIETIYADDALTTPLANPFFADVDGNFDFYLAAPRRVKIRAHTTLLGTFEQDNVYVPAADNTLPGTWTGDNLFLDGYFRMDGTALGGIGRGGLGIDKNSRMRIGNGASAYATGFGDNTTFGISIADDLTDLTKAVNEVVFDVVHDNRNRGLQILFNSTVVSATSNTLTAATGLFGSVNAWVSCVVTITGGTGAGQVRRVLSNTITVLTLRSNWSVTPDATSTFTLEGLLTSGTATSGGASTLTDSTKSTDWASSEFIGYVVRILSGTGSGQARKITANTTTQLTVSPAWTTQPDATSVYEVRKAGDDGVARFVQLLRAQSNTSSRAIEVHINREAGSPHLGTLAMELSCGVSTDTLPDPTYARGIALGAFQSFLGGTSGESGIGIHYWGSGGWTEYERFDNASGVTEAKILKGGHLWTKGRITVGQAALSNAALDIKQTVSDDINGGFVIRPSDSSSMRFGLFHGGAGDPRPYFEAINGAEAALMMVDSRSAQSTLIVQAATTHTGPLAQFIYSTVKASIDVNGNTDIAGVYSIAAQQVVKGRMTDIGAITASNFDAVPASFADLAAVRTYLNTLVGQLESRDDTQDTKINAIRDRISAAAGGHGLTD